ncbi:hypothetical protein ABFS82_10G004400 [Erythranthe guttata]|uniref:Non-specific lipid-transfer protein n=1 Tax=Erythranthe guttata TaxID=4155 RepID=A0A022RNF8_ERYGU|nr:PREDICTED: non-specific lipid-transfer protein 1-like [Erythranthe guttata]EYU42017.1 hypothetical protein MIMGU_mgv1a016521mg [Erythranthe guttata]|eukprot:XP_012831855.1 PREDICTED: non-specific lipid-transfer protein 1-like [Erythranthe guttata]
MANNKAVMIIVVVAAIVMVGFSPQGAEGITCQTVVKGLMPCTNYLRKGGAIPSACCRGVRSINSAAKTTADRRTACECIKVAAKAYKVNVRNAAVLPRQCKVNIGYAISYSTDCKKVR